MKRALILLSLLALTFVAGWLWIKCDPSTTLVDASGKALTASLVQRERVTYKYLALQIAAHRTAWQICSSVWFAVIKNRTRVAFSGTAG